MQSKKTALHTKLTPVQLQQRLIYTQSELNKYKTQVERYQNDYYYNMIDEFKDKEKQWVTEKTELQSELQSTLTQLQKVQTDLSELQSEFEKVRQKEKADIQSAEVEVEEPIKQKDVQPDIQLDREGPSKNQDWFLRSVKNPKKK
ncbi:hypothetical protein [Alkalicoccobacillus murimartini]|uniref:DNA repair exonuclease SbcCD ATPase subunit n=1 Tax=Alkalicoccobacillus murimartini TaxID=171685 RepID=A0ABT9YJ28_9BACI|nr:hypothetical protein [Alkalicoccobacillus murimartini]MDQ0207859.1 DNA repair exonuclease SbcCD ATPase subunit [Alkalicoccobacillus murimartini]